MNPQIPASGQQLYDEIMAKIEPELTTTQLPSLAEKYKNETPEQAKARAERYSKAFLAYEKAYVPYVGELNRGLTDYRKELLKAVENEEREQRMNLIAKMELSFCS